MKALLLTVLLCLSCEKPIEIVQNYTGSELTNVRMEISHVEDYAWHVGVRREATVTQSFSFIVSMPKLKKDDLEFLKNTKDVDGWIIRVIQVRSSESQDLGSLYTLFEPKVVSRGISAGPATSVAIRIWYAAAYASERFRSLKCPAFGHDKLLKDIEIKGPDEPFSIVIGQSSYYQEKSQLIQLSASSFNGGNSLLAEYHLEIAPYNSKKKMILGPFKRLPNYVEVVREESVNTKSCKGVIPTLN